MVVFATTRRRVCCVYVGSRIVYVGVPLVYVEIEGSSFFYRTFRPFSCMLAHYVDSFNHET